MQKPYFPMGVLRITQGENSNYSHKGSLAMDFGGKDTGKDKVYAPCDMRVVRVRTDSSHETYTESLEPVLYADGTKDYISFTFMHDDYLNPNLRVGAVIKQGDYFFDEGGFGGSRPNSFGAHLHLEVSRGKSPAKQVKNAYGTWVTPNQYPIYKALWIKQNTTVLNSGGYPWVKDTGNNNVEEQKTMAMSTQPVKMWIGPMSSGDLEKFETFMNTPEINIPYTLSAPDIDGNKTLTTTVSVVKADQPKLIDKAISLGLGYGPFCENINSGITQEQYDAAIKAKEAAELAADEEKRKRLYAEKVILNIQKYPVEV